MEKNVSQDSSIFSDRQVHLEPFGSRAFSVSLMVGLAALAVAVFLGVSVHDNMQTFLFGYLIAWCCLFGIAAGSLYFLMIHHAFRVYWSVVIRKLVEALACNMVVVALLSVPILFGLHELYIWNHLAYMHSDPLLARKLSFLNEPFFLVRVFIYFVALTGMAFYLRSKSMEQDQTGSIKPLQAMYKNSRWGMVMMFWIINFVGIDFIMSLDPKWYSYLMGGYFFAAVMVMAMAAIPLFTIWLQDNGRLEHAITTEHYHDMGKWLYAWTIIWGYFAFCQYMLTWYGNLPWETSFYVARMLGPWWIVTLALLFVHLIIPGFGLVSKHVKRNRSLLTFWCVWMLVAEWLDFYWLIAPTLWINNREAKTGYISPHDPYKLMGPAHGIVWLPLRATAIEIDILCVVGLGGIFVASALYFLRDRALMPLKDPKLAASLAFENY